MKPQDVEEALGSPSPELRRQGTRSLASLPPAARPGWAMKSLGDEDWRVRKTAVDACVSLGDKAPLEELVAAMRQGENVGLRNAAIEALSKLGEPAVERLRESLREDQGGARKFVAEALGEARAQSAVPELEALLRDRDPNLVGAAIDALGRIASEGANEALRRELPRLDAFGRMAALDALAGSEAVLPWAELEPLVGTRIAVRAALPLLGRCGHCDAVGPLREALGFRSQHVAGRAALALSELLDSFEDTTCIGALPPEEVQRLRELASQGPRRVRRAAVHLLVLLRRAEAWHEVLSFGNEEPFSPPVEVALKAWGGEAVEGLVAALDQLDASVLPFALEVAAELGEHAPREVQEPLRHRLRDALRPEGDALSCSAARGLGLLGEPEDIERLLPLVSSVAGPLQGAGSAALDGLGKRHPQRLGELLKTVRLEQCEAGEALPALMVSFRGPDCQAMLVSGLQAERASMRRACTDALGRLGELGASSQTGLQTVALALADDAPEVRLAAVGALAGFGQDALPMLRPALEADDPEVLVAALRAVGRMAAESLRAEICALCDHARPAVAVAALEALAALPEDDAFWRCVDGALIRPEAEVAKAGLSLARSASESLPRLARGLSHDAWDVRLFAAQLLGDAFEESVDPSLGPFWEGLRREHRDEGDAMVRDALGWLWAR